MKTITMTMVIIGIIILGCENETNDKLPNYEIETFDTIYPGDYLPAYPGSFWVYSDGDTITTKENYELHTIYQPQYDISTGVEIFDTCISIDTAFFPIYNEKVLNRYTLYSSSDNRCSKYRFLDETEGTGWTISSSKNDQTSMRVKVKDTVITLPNNDSYEYVIVMSMVYTIYPHDIFEVEHYYAKDIGFIGSKTLYDQLEGIDSAKWGDYLIKCHINLE